jgi:nicotinic acetylcholine receptor
MLVEVNGNTEAKRLLHELMKDYNKHVLPVQSINQTVNVTLGLKLSQLSDIDERNQIMTTNVWLQHVNIDFNKKQKFVFSCDFRNGMIIN